MWPGLISYPSPGRDRPLGFVNGNATSTPSPAPRIVANPGVTGGLCEADHPGPAVVIS
jgi:hypothetical protein